MTDFGSDFGYHFLETLYRPRICRLAAVELRRFPLNTILALPTDGEMLPICGRHVGAEQVHPAWSKRHLREAIAKCTSTGFIDESVIIIGRFGMRCWDNWLAELLPKVVCVEAVRPGRYRYLLPNALISDPLLAHHRESLEFYGLGPGRLLLLQSGRSYMFRELASVSSVWSDYTMHPGAIDVMRRHPHAPSGGIDRPDRIALFQRGSSTWALANQEEIQRLLVSHGWCTIEIAELTFADQVATFEAASTIVSILGSGLAALMYAPVGVRVLVLAPVDWGDYLAFAIMQNRHAALADIRGEKLPRDPGPADTSWFHVRLQDVERGLRGFGQLPHRSRRPQHLGGANVATGLRWSASYW